MAINLKKILGITTAVAVIGVTIYTIKKYRDTKKQDEQGIDLEDAKRIVQIERKQEVVPENVVIGSSGQVHYNPDLKPNPDRILRVVSDDELSLLSEVDEDEPSSERRHPNDNEGETNLTPEQLEKLRDEARDTANWNASFAAVSSIPVALRRRGEAPEPLLQDEEEGEEEPDYEEIMNSRGYFEQEGVGESLRYDPNSIEAREQFINMELATLGRENETRDIVAMLYDHVFIPTCDEDQNLKGRLLDHRIKFFGFVSKWTKDVTYGDLIMYYARAAEYNCGESVRHWVDHFLMCSDMNDVVMTSDEFDERIIRLNNHNYFNPEYQSYGLFGLDSTQMDAVCNDAAKRIDERVTYDLEFQQFVQGVIG